MLDQWELTFKLSSALHWMWLVCKIKQHGTMFDIFQIEGWTMVDTLSSFCTSLRTYRFWMSVLMGFVSTCLTDPWFIAKKYFVVSKITVVFKFHLVLFLYSIFFWMFEILRNSLELSEQYLLHKSAERSDMCDIFKMLSSLFYLHFCLYFQSFIHLFSYLHFFCQT